MNDNQDTVEVAGNQASKSGGFGGLIAILIAIVLGALLGIYYGEPMWIAHGGPAKEMKRLEEIKRQKLKDAEATEIKAAESGAAEDLAKAGASRAKADKQVSIIDQRIAAVSAMDVDGSPLAGVVWEVTDFIGDLFLQVLKLLVIPLVVTSMICGITSLGDIRKVGRVGVWTIAYYMSTGAVAVLIGILLVVFIRPGDATDDTYHYKAEKVASKEGTTVLGTLLNVVRGSDRPGSGMFPSNIFQAANSTNVLALIVFALIFGGALTTVGSRGQPVIDFFVGANEAVMKMVHVAMWFAPVGIGGLVAANIAKNGGGAQFGAELGRLSWYVLVVLVGLGLHFILLSALLPLLARRNPLRYILGILRALLTAMSTASSAATLPVTMETVEENNQVSKRSASFVLPLGATINMDGTALYEAVAVIFIAQTLGLELALGQLVVIFLTATLAAVGAAGIPEAGLVTMVIVLTAVGLPMEGIGTILAIDWFLDRMRTTVNVYGDAVGAAIIDHNVVAPE